MKKRLTAKQIKVARQIYTDRNCADCGWLYAAVSWWCSNKEAIEDRHTSLPNTCYCPWWKPDKRYIRKLIKNINQ